MNIPKEIIEKAIEGGYLFKARYRSSSAHVVYEDTDEMTAIKTMPEIALDPTFWQALFPIHDGRSVHAETQHGYIMPTWLARAHRFYDLILTGQPTEEFWEELLS